MSLARTFREINLAHLGTYALIILLYAIYVLGTLLEFDFGDQAIDAIAYRLLGAPGLFVVGLAFLRRVFVTQLDA